MRNVRMVSPVSVSVCRLFRRAERFFIGVLNAQHRPVDPQGTRAYPMTVMIRPYPIETVRNGPAARQQLERGHLRPSAR
jgi:hypothetical protein